MMGCWDLPCSVFLGNVTQGLVTCGREFSSVETEQSRALNPAYLCIIEIYGVGEGRR
jgi:hypothetical protein